MIEVTVLFLKETFSSTAVGPMEVFRHAGSLWNILAGEKQAPPFHVTTASVDGKAVDCDGAIQIKPNAGINDIRNRRGLAAEVVTAGELIGGLGQMATRARDRGIKLFGGTLTPFENETFMLGAYTPEGEAKRLAVNEWVRNSGAFDAVIDFDEGLRDPDHPARMLALYDNGDHLHPSDAGYNRMGDLIELALFD